MLDISKISELTQLNVLYVEDDDETREELELILQNWFKNLHIAVNGREGLALYKQYRPDIVISDIQMPEMNGLSMSAEIKKIDSNQEIIILSAYNDVEFLFRALEMGIKHYITKPISIGRLLDKLLEIKQQIQLQEEVKLNRKLLDQYKTLVDEKAIVAKVNLQGRISYVNQQFCTLSGYTEEELLGQPYLFTFVKNTQELALDELKESVLQNKKWQGLLKKVRKDGSTYIVDMTVMAIVDAAEQIEEFVALILDMTEVHEKFEHISLNLKQNLQAQQHYFNEYERAMELGTSLCVLDTDGNIISANTNFSTTLNCQTEELIGASFCDMVIDPEDFKHRVLDKVQDRGFASRIIHVNTEAGYKRTLYPVFVAVNDEAGVLHSIMVLSRDISDSVQLSEDIIEAQKELIYILGEVVENRSGETGLHIKRVAQISHLLAEKYGLSPDYAQMVKITSPMHDIGKVGIPDHILHKTGKLTAQEYKAMQKHTEIGYNLLNKLNRPLINMAATIAHQHHEHYDGQGYPQGLSGNNIAIEARIVALVDVFDALSSARSYKQPWSIEKIIEYLLAKRGSQFDPELVDLLLENIEQICSIRQNFQDQK